MRLHFLGICGTFMGSLALLAREMGHQVSGCDAMVYPPMSTQLEQQGIVIYQGYDVEQFESFGDDGPDLVVIGNALSRGNPAVEYVLDKQIDYTSGPQWLSEHLLNKKWVLAVAGTHGKTTTTSMLAWILECAGFQPGFLIGGVPANFDCSARVGESDFFVIEADEYDTAFFDKRSKFVHYHPRTLIMNNLEYDHADIFPDIEAIQKQFHHLVRIVPSQGRVIYPQNHKHLNEVLEQGVWSEVSKLSFDTMGGAFSDVLPDAPRDDETFPAQTKIPETENNCDLHAKKLEQDGSRFEISHKGRGESGVISWGLIGDHNIQNGLAACAAAFHVGVPLVESVKALQKFVNVKRRLELISESTNSHLCHISVYDDFAHHPTAIAGTLQAMRDKVGDERLIAVLEPRSNTMKSGVHGNHLVEACCKADEAFWFVDQDELLATQLSQSNCKSFDNVTNLLESLLIMAASTQQHLHFVIMSNGGFSGLPKLLSEGLAGR